MEGLLNLLPLYSDDIEAEHNLGKFLETCRTHQSFGEFVAKDKEIDHAVKIVNAKLNSAETRVEGTLLLDVIITQCGTDIFTSNCVSWTQQVMRLLHGTSKTCVGHIACAVLGKLLAFSSQFPEVSRQISMTVISQLLALLCEPEFTQKATIALHVLECLKSCMEYYGSPCGPAKATIEKTLYSLIDWDDMATNSYLRSKWSSCITLLPSLGGGGTLGANHKTNWIEFCLQLIDSIHSTVNDMFRNIDELKAPEVSANPLKLPVLNHKNPMVLLHAQQRRFTNLCSALSFLLKEPFPTPKNIPIDRLLVMISRLLALNSKSLSKTTRANFEQLTLGSIIPDLQMAVLDVLTSLVAVCRSQLMTRATAVMNLFVQVLQWTFTPLDRRRVASERPYGKLRSQVYRSLCLWIAASRSACGLTKCVDVLFTQILSDIVVHRSTVQLLTVNQPSSGIQTSKKGKKKVIDTLGVILQKDDLKANSDVCQAALQCLSTILLYCGPRIKPTIHKEIQEVVLSILIEMMNGAELKSLLPYNDPRCRIGLYQVLEKLILCPNPHWPAPLNYASAVLNSGMNDPNVEVAAVCVQSLVAIQSILRPRGPSLNFSFETKQLRVIQEEVTLLNNLDSTAARNNAESAAPATSSTPLVPQTTLEADVPAEQPTLPVQDIRPSSPVRTIEIRQPETSPKPSKRLSLSNGRHQDDYSTPPHGVTSIADATESPSRSTRMMTRKEALKVIAAVTVSSAQPKTEPMSSPSKPDRLPETHTSPSSRKRPHQDSKLSASPQEKVLKELPYGTDEADDNLESMLASFRDVPPE